MSELTMANRLEGKFSTRDIIRFVVALILLFVMQAMSVRPGSEFVGPIFSALISTSILASGILIASSAKFKRLVSILSKVGINGERSVFVFWYQSIISAFVVVYLIPYLITGKTFSENYIDVVGFSDSNVLYAFLILSAITCLTFATVMLGEIKFKHGNPVPLDIKRFKLGVAGMISILISLSVSWVAFLS